MYTQIKSIKIRTFLISYWLRIHQVSEAACPVSPSTLLSLPPHARITSISEDRTQGPMFTWQALYLLNHRISAVENSEIPHCCGSQSRGKAPFMHGAKPRRSIHCTA